MGKLQEFVTWIEWQTDMKVKRLRSDNGKEYKSKRSHAWFEKTGIQWEPTVPYTPEQNGVSESLNQTLMDRVSSVLFDKGLDARLWAEVANTVIYLKIELLRLLLVKSRLMKPGMAIY